MNLIVCRFRPAALGDNAMFYKDLTQWLRNRTFAGLFFGLLLLAEGISVFVSSMPMEVGQVGPVVFNYLLLVLLLYGGIIAFSGYSLTSKEFQNRTFELYELSGMSLEKMIRGKFLSMAAQFLFGFFCIVPFLFFSYLLGGLDFYSILGAILVLAILFPPLFLFALTVALFSQKVKVLSTLVRVGAIFLLIGVGLILLRILAAYAVVLLFGGHRGVSPFDMGRIVKAIWAGGYEPLAWLGGFAFFHVLFCLLLFYLCCNAISPVTDSREGAVKFLTTVLCGGLMAVGPVVFLCTKAAIDDCYGLLLLVFLVECLMGLLYFWGPMEVPLMALRRQKESRWVSIRFLSYWFQAGPAGTFRTLLLLWGGALVLYWTDGGIPDSMRTNREETFRFMALLLAVPFWVVTPGVFLLGIKRFRQSPLVMRMTLLLWWGLGGGLIILIIPIHEAIRNNSDSLVLGFLTSVLTPFSALIASFSPSSVGFESDSEAGLSIIWLFLGMAGLILVARTLSNRLRLEKADRQAALQAVSLGNTNPGDSEPSLKTPPPLPTQSVEGME